MSKQIRIRLPHVPGAQLLALPPAVRAQTVALTLNASAAKVDLAALAGYRRELANLGKLINQSLQLSRGTSFDVTAAERAVELINSLIEK